MSESIVHDPKPPKGKSQANSNPKLKAAARAAMKKVNIGNDAIAQAVRQARERMAEMELQEKPWLREPYEAAKQLERDIPDLTLLPGLSDAAIAALAEDIPKGDAPPWGPRVNAYAVPWTYLDFLKLVGGFDYGQVRLDGKSISVYRSEEERRSGPTMGHVISFEVSYPIQLLLGKCDHGIYLFDTRWNNYLLEGFGHTTYFDDCIGMLLHAMWRVAENREGR